MVVVARTGSRAVAGAVFLHTGKRALYKFGAADAAFSGMRPSNFVMAAGIRHLIASGFESLHFGRTCKANVGLARYKRGWGAAEEALDYYRYDLRVGQWLEEGARSRDRGSFFRYMPLMANRIFGKLLYPHLD